MSELYTPRPATPEEERQIVGRAWSFPLDVDTPEGTKVRVLLDDGSVFETETRSEPWRLGHGEWVVLGKGRTGGIWLKRVTPL